MPFRALDLFCCAGGASMGLHRAGFDVTGSLPDTAGNSVRWTNDAGRSDVWTGALVNGSVPALPVSNLRGPALQ